MTVDGQQYREFVLNVDQIDANGDRQLSVDEIQIFTSTASNLRNYNNANNTLRAGTLIESPIWSLDALNGSTNDWLQVRAMTNQGNRAGELALLIPNEPVRPQRGVRLHLLSHGRQPRREPRRRAVGRPHRAGR